jgi:Asp-tRNA(Asn)/Glu-tRNA(Gln) amidotransferase A subunit family amidase
MTRHEGWPSADAPQPRGLFGEVDILLTPSAPGAAPAGWNTTGDPRFNKLWTLMGSPAHQHSGLQGSAGMPLGIQAVARFGQDKALLCGRSA